MHKLERISLVCAWCLTSFSLSFASAQDTLQPSASASTLNSHDDSKGKESTAEPRKFLRLLEKSKRPHALEVAVTRYESASVGGAEIDLVGAVHIGEASYYAELNQLFEKYDVVLYELVAPEGTVIPKGGKREGASHPIAMLQESARKFLALESQLAQVDYTKTNFARADMTPQQMSDKMAERGDTPITIALSAIADVMRQQNIAARGGQNGAGLQPLLDAEFNLADLFGEPLKLKQLLAKQLAATGSLDQALGGTLNQLLVIDRNEVATKVLQQQLASGKKRIAIFYGAAHMPDFHRRLVNDFGMHVASVRWLTAWDLTRSDATALDNPAALLLRLFESLE